MTKKILAITILALAVCLALAFANPVMAQETVTKEKAVASVTKSDGTITYYEKLDEALTAVENGSVLKLEKSYTIPTGDSNNGYVVSRDKNFTVDLNGQELKSTLSDNHGAFYVVGGEVTFIDSSASKTGKIETTSTGAAALVIQKGKATLQGGTYKCPDNSTTSAVQVGGQPAGSGEETNIGDLTVENGTIENGIFVTSTGSKLTVNGGTITAKNKHFAISGNGDTTAKGKTTITINGGTMTSDFVAIYHPQDGTLTINGGTITGKNAGIVARQGDVTVNGGKITATTKDTGSVGSGAGAAVQLQFGSAIIVDNETEAYSDSASVKINGGELTSAKGEDTVKSYTESGDPNLDDFDIEGGAFSEKFNPGFIKSDKPEVSIEKNGDKTYYVGKTAEEAVEHAKPGSVVTVEQGNLTVDHLPNGVIVSGESKGSVTVKNPTSSGETSEKVKSDLQALIEKAEGEENLSEELKNAIEEARKTLENAGSTYGDLKAALEKLQGVYDSFKNGTESPANPEGNNPEGNGTAGNQNGEKGKGELDDEPKMGESFMVAGIMLTCVIFAIVIRNRKHARR